MTLIKILVKLTKTSGGLERVDTVDLLVSITEMRDQDPHVSEYLNGLKDGKKKAKRSSRPFSDNLIAAITSSSLLKAKSFPKDRPKWDGKILEEKTLKAWEDYFLHLHKALEWEARLATGRGNAFGSAHFAILIHGITTSATVGTSGRRGEVAPASFMEQFDGHFGALSTAATRSTVMMETMATATTMHYEKILAAMDELKTLRIAAAETTGSRNRDSTTGRLTPDEWTESNILIN